jgi:hypothetical protein
VCEKEKTCNVRLYRFFLYVETRFFVEHTCHQQYTPDRVNPLLTRGVLMLFHGYLTPLGIRSFIFAVLIFLFVHGAQRGGGRANTKLKPIEVTNGKFSLFLNKYKLSRIIQPILPLPKQSVKFPHEFDLEERTVHLPKDEILRDVPVDQYTNKLLGVSRSYQDKRLRIILKHGFALVSVAVWPLGWKHYPMILTRTSDSTLVASTYGKSHLPQSKFTIDISKDDPNNDIVVSTNVQYSRMKLVDVKLIGETLADLLTKELNDQLIIIAGRSHQLKQYNRLSSENEEQKKQLKLDKIINPEKYRSHSPTVRKPGSSGCGSGRFTPSAATKARREVRRS